MADIEQVLPKKLIGRCAPPIKQEATCEDVVRWLMTVSHQLEQNMAEIAELKRMIINQTVVI